MPHTLYVLFLYSCVTHTLLEGNNAELLHQRMSKYQYNQYKAYPLNAYAQAKEYVNRFHCLFALSNVYQINSPYPNHHL